MVVKVDFTDYKCSCPFCGKVYSVQLPTKELKEGIEAYKYGALLQNAFPTFTASQREALKTGICDTCWEKL